MSSLKAELKILVTNDVGIRVDDALDAAKRDLAILEGRNASFLDGAKAVEALLGAVDKDIEEGKLELPTAEVVKRYILRCSAVLQNLAAQASNYRIAQTGKIQGFEHTIKLLKSMMEAEQAKIEQAKETAASPVQEDVPTGVRPDSIKSIRLAEEAASQTPGGAVVEPVIVTKFASSEDSADTSQRKKRRANNP